MRAGVLNKRAAFLRRTLMPDGAGGATEIWAPFVTVWAQLVPERGRERIRAGRLDAAVAGVLRIRSSTATRSISTEDRVRLDDITYDIRAIANPDQRNVMLELTVESVA